MKRMDFVIEKQNNMDVIKYILGAADVYDDKATDKASQLPNIIPFQYQDVDGKRIYNAYAHEDTTLDVFLKKTLTKPEVYGILGSLASAFEIGAKGIPVSYIVKDTSCIYVNRDTLMVKVLLLPLKQDNMPLSEIPAFFREIVSGMRFDETDTDNYVAKILTQINADDFSASNFKAFIDAEMEKIGMFIHKENGPMSMSVGGSQTPAKDVKVNKIGVMNNMRPQGMPPQGMALQQMPPQGMRPQGMVLQQMPPQGMALQQMPPQGMAPQGMPKPAPQGMPPQGMAPQGMPPQGMAPQGMPPQGMAPQGMLPQEASKPVMQETSQPQNAPQQDDKQDINPTEENKEPAPQASVRETEKTIGNLVGQLGTRPIPHLVRKKTGEIINITKPEFKIGKAVDRVDYAITDNVAISRVHCVIVQKDGVNYIKDNGSTNHTYMDGAELAPAQEKLLKHKTTILLGDEEFTFLLRKGD